MDYGFFQFFQTKRTRQSWLANRLATPEKYGKAFSSTFLIPKIRNRTASDVRRIRLRGKLPSCHSTRYRKIQLFDNTASHLVSYIFDLAFICQSHTAFFVLLLGWFLSSYASCNSICLIGSFLFSFFIQINSYCLSVFNKVYITISTILCGNLIASMPNKVGWISLLQRAIRTLKGTCTWSVECKSALD